MFKIVINLTSESNALFANALGVLANSSLLSILGARLLFNMKEAGDRGVNAGTNCELKTLSNIDFAGGVEEHLNEGNEDVEDIV